MPVENLILEYMFGSSIVWMLLKTIALYSVYLALVETIILTSQISMKYAFLKKLWKMVWFRAVRTIRIFTQMNSVNPYLLSAMLVVRHCGSCREKDIVPSVKGTTTLIGWISITELHSKIETR